MVAAVAAIITGKTDCCSVSWKEVSGWPICWRVTSGSDDSVGSKGVGAEACVECDEGRIVDGAVRGTTTARGPYRVLASTHNAVSEDKVLHFRGGCYWGVADHEQHGRREGCDGVECYALKDRGAQAYRDYGKFTRGVVFHAIDVVD